MLFLGGECVNVLFDCERKCWVQWLSDDDRDRTDFRRSNGDSKCTEGRGKYTNRRKCASATILLSAHAIIYRSGKAKYLLFGVTGRLEVGLVDLEPWRLFPIPRN